MAKNTFTKWKARAIKTDARNFHSKYSFYREIGKLALDGYQHTKFTYPEQWKEIESILLSIRKTAKLYKNW